MKIDIKDIIGLIPYEVTQEQGIPWVRNINEIHNGVDLKLPKFTIVSFPVDGIVTRASYHFSDPIHAFGNRVSEYCILESRKVELYFCHLDGTNPALHFGEDNGGYPKVKKGDMVGRIGATGSCIGQNGGIHLHISVRNYDDGSWLWVKEYIDFN